uniref:Uncharacterized protein n=1 Tax=Utricularia reniformis TaxID=192314 RepID=A0A1Y0B472_9LAMI|nr:hypothetical protein AEK19_MT2103 [Utricularia reniformis]ART32256.1 hypothetical protein AEK19_MT2103 [Utricularia reniformis]
MAARLGPYEIEGRSAIHDIFRLLSCCKPVIIKYAFFLHCTTSGV